MSLGITHSVAINNDQITILKTGIYHIDFSVTSDSAMFCAIAVNGVIQISSEYGSSVGGSVLNGTIILSLNAGDILTLVNYSTLATVTLSNNINSNPRIGASLLIQQIQ